MPGTVNIELGALASRLQDVAQGPVLVMYGYGERAMGAASILKRAGRTDLMVLDGGLKDRVAATGRPVQIGIAEASRR